MSPASSPPVFSHPAAIFNQFVVSLVDHSVLKLCQDGDAGALSRYLSLHQDKISARNLNATDQTGKVNQMYGCIVSYLILNLLLLVYQLVKFIVRGNDRQCGHYPSVNQITRPGSEFS